MEEERIETMVSNLPHEVLCQIVSLMPLKEAVRTSILSTSWKSLWTPFEVEFEFGPNQMSTTGDNEEDSDEAKKKINQIMGFLFKPSSCPELWKFSLQMGKREKSLFLLAAKGGGKELHLDFFGGGKEIQSNFYNLILEPKPRISSFSSIKTLHMVSVNQVCKDLVSTLFFNCHFLETLKLEKCSGLQSIDIKEIHSLKNFEMVDCVNLERIEISAPNLKSLWYRGVLPLFQINSCPNLVDVVLDFRDGLGYGEFDCEDVLNLLSSLKDAEILRISGWLIEWLCGAGVIFGLLEFKFNKLKELRWFDSLMNQTKRDSLACFLHISPLLEKLFVEIDENMKSINSPYFHQHWHEPHMWGDYETARSNVCGLQNLKTIELEGFRMEGEYYELMMLMDLLVWKAVTLKSMTIILPEKQPPLSVSKIPNSQLKHTSGYNLNRILIPSPYNYFFGLTQQQNTSSSSSL